MASGLIGFSVAMFAVCWAWVNFSWFASAYDTEDRAFRVATMVQMVGVLIFSLGLPDLFRSLDEGHRLNNTVMVAGYVVMRVAMVFQWSRAASQDPARRSARLTYMTTILVAQVGWVLLVLVETSFLGKFLLAVPLILIELSGPWIAETRKGGTPRHAHHIAERYGLLVVTLAPAVTVVGYEAIGYRHLAAILNRALPRD